MELTSQRLGFALNHSPAPWRSSAYEQISNPTKGWIDDANGEPIVGYAGCGTHEAEWTRIADKVLALASPDLYAALRECAKEFGLHNLPQNARNVLNNLHKKEDAHE